MADQSNLRALYRLHADSESKYVYFLLAAVGAALGYGLQKLDATTLSWWATPGLAALVCWLGSFFCGCKRITWVHSAMYANYALLQLQHGLHPEQPPHPQLLEAAMQGTRSAIESNNVRARAYYRWQFYLLGAGVGLFVAWRVIEMVRASVAP